MNTTLDQINTHLAAIADLARQQQQTIERLSNPLTPPPQPAQGDGEQSLWTELASIDLTTGEDRGLLRLRGKVLSGYMIGLKMQTRLTATGEWADYLEGPDFDTPNAMMPHSSAFGSDYIADGGMGHRFEITLDVRGIHSIRVLAVAEETPASGTVVQITEACL